MTLLAGVDLSVSRLDVAIIPLDPDTPRDPVFVTEHVPQATDKSQRCRQIGRIIPLMLRDYDQDVTMVWVEEPYGPYRTADRALLPVYGAVLASIPAWMEATGITTREWRSVLGLPLGLSKTQAILEAHSRCPDLERTLDEHEAEAVLVALAGRAECERGAIG